MIWNWLPSRIERDLTGATGDSRPSFFLAGAAAEVGISQCTSLGRFTMRWLVQANGCEMVVVA